MTEFIDEPLYVGMDVDAALARYEEEDRRRADAAAAKPPTPKRTPTRRGLRAAIPGLGKGAVPPSPLAA